MNKQEIDKQAEREAIALQRQGRMRNTNMDRVRLQAEYNQDKFNRLFRKD